MRAFIVLTALLVALTVTTAEACCPVVTSGSAFISVAQPAFVQSSCAAVQVQSFAVPAVSVLATPVIVQQQAAVSVRVRAIRPVLRPRAVVRTRTVVR